MRLIVSKGTAGSGTGSSKRTKQNRLRRAKARNRHGFIQTRKYSTFCTTIFCTLNTFFITVVYFDYIGRLGSTWVCLTSQRKQCESRIIIYCSTTYRLLQAWKNRNNIITRTNGTVVQQRSCKVSPFSTVLSLSSLELHQQYFAILPPPPCERTGVLITYQYPSVANDTTEYDTTNRKNNTKRSVCHPQEKFKSL